MIILNSIISNPIMNLPSNLAKSSMLATCIFWTIGMTDGFDLDMIPIIFFSYIPIFIMCSLTIIITICPFFWLAENKNFTKENVFYTYFPYYAIICFTICLYSIFSISYEAFLIGFFVAVFFTTMQSWIWFVKEREI